MNQQDKNLELQMLTVGDWQENCYLLIDPAMNQAILIDPGDEPDRIIDWMRGISVQKIVITHAHKDHIGAVNSIRSALSLPVYLHPLDLELAKGQNVLPDFYLEENESILLGQHVVNIYHTPGHTPGSVILLCKTIALVGDVIFPGGPGHTNTPEELSQSMASMRKTVFTWPDNTILYPGHGTSTTVGKERSGFNTFFNKTLPVNLFGDVTWNS
jgi:hydroxyacylglutathione hydrolase